MSLSGRSLKIIVYVTAKTDIVLIMQDLCVVINKIYI